VKPPSAYNQFVSLAVNVYYLDAGVIFQIFSQPGNKDIHAAAVEIILVTPYSPEGQAAVQGLTAVHTQQVQQFRFAGGKSEGVAFPGQDLLCAVKPVFAYFEIGARVFPVDSSSAAIWSIFSV